MRYLALNYYRFGDWGLATWAYHAGEGNLAKAVQLYAKSVSGKNLPRVKDPKAIRDYVEKSDVTIHNFSHTAQSKLSPKNSKTTPPAILIR